MSIPCGSRNAKTLNCACTMTHCPPSGPEKEPISYYCSNIRKIGVKDRNPSTHCAENNESVTCPPGRYREKCIFERKAKCGKMGIPCVKTSSRRGRTADLAVNSRTL
eukprot:6197845-Pleurochrysis_carterae.AAC.1